MKCRQTYGSFDLALIYSNILPHAKYEVFDDDYLASSLLLNGDFNRKIVDFGLKMQSFLVEDPEDGDVKMSEYLQPIVGYSLNTARAPALADEPLISWNAGTNISKAFLTGYQNLDYAHGKSQKQLLKEAWEEVCADCAAIIFESWQYQSTVQRINPKDLKFHDLVGNSTISPDCRDIISQPEAMDLLAAVPPVNLVNSYYECSKTPSAAFTSALGSALASSTAIMAAAWVVGGWVFVYFANRYFRLSAFSKLPSLRVKKEIHEAFEETKNETLALLMHEIIAALEQQHPTTAEGKEQRMRLNMQYEKFRRLYDLLLSTNKNEHTEPRDVRQPIPETSSTLLSREIAAKVDRQRSRRRSVDSSRKSDHAKLESGNPLQTASVNELEMRRMPQSPRESITSAVMRSSMTGPTGPSPLQQTFRHSASRLSFPSEATPSTETV